MPLLKIILYKILIFFYKLSKKYFYQSLKVIESFKLDLIIEYFKKNNSLEYIYDIGSNNGSFSLERNEKSLKNKKFYLFDVVPPLFLKKNMSFFCKLLSNNINVVNFYKIREPGVQGTGDSIFRENTKLYNDIKGEKIITTTLDHVIQENRLPQPDFIKIDTQGSELSILQGAKIALNSTKLLVIELPIIEFNLGAPKFNEILDFLKKKSFIPYDIVETHYLDNQLIQMDIIFVNYKLISSKDIQQNILNII